MGFDGFLFSAEQVQEAHTAARAAVKAEKTTQYTQPHMVGCEYCPLLAERVNIRSPEMPMTGATEDGDILVLGEGPGQTEDAMNEQFIGPSGDLLRNILPWDFMYRVCWQNVVRCRPPENRTPSLREAHACSIYLDADIASRDFKGVLLIGAAALARYYPGVPVQFIHGIPFPVKTKEGRGMWALATYHPAFVLRTRKVNQQGRVYDDGPYMPSFRADLRRFVEEIDNLPEPEFYNFDPAKVILPRSAAEANALIDRMNGPLGVDIETIKLRPYERDATLLTVAFSDGNTTIAFPIDHPEAPTTWGRAVLLRAITTRKWIAHNANMELSWFMWNFPNDSFEQFHDTMALLRLYHRRESLLGLDHGTRLHLGTNVKSILNINTANIVAYPIEQTLRYNGLDAEASALLFRKLRRRVHRPDYERLINAVTTLTTMELMGLPTDQPKAKVLEDKYKSKAETLAKDARTTAIVRQYLTTGTDFNIGSPKQLGEAFRLSGIQLPMTKKGVYKTDEDVLQPLADKGNALAKAVLDYRDATKINSTYIAAVREVPKRYVDAMLHPGYTIMRTSTQRTSSEDPNIQNWPRGHEVKELIVAPEGHLLYKFDYGQLEARVLAMATCDEQLVWFLRTGNDIHAKWRDRMLALHPEYRKRLADALMKRTGLADEKSILAEGRNVVKSDFVFSSFYGGGWQSCCDRTGLPETVVKRMLDELWSEFPAIPKWHEEKRREYRETGGVYTLSGRQRWGTLSKGNEPINTPIQGTAADIVVDSQNELAALARSTGNWYLHPRINIHDDLTFVFPDDERAIEYIQIVQKACTRLRYDWQIVPLTLEGARGKNWRSMDKLPKELDPVYTSDEYIKG